MSRLTRVSVMVLLAVLMVSVMAACGSTALNNPTTDATLPDGMQVFSVTDQMNGTLSVNAPKGIFSKSDPSTGSLSLATQENYLSAKDTSVFPAGQWGLSIGALPTNIAQAFVTNGQTLTPQIVVDAIKKQMAAAVAQVSFGDSQATTIGGHTSARATGTSPQGDILLLVIELDKGYLLVTGVTSKGELKIQEPVMTSIVTSATYTTK